MQHNIGRDRVGKDRKMYKTITILCKIVAKTSGAVATLYKTVFKTSEIIPVLYRSAPKTHKT